MVRPARPVNRAAQAALLAAPLLLGGCGYFAADRELRGHRVAAEQLRELTPGVQTKADVAALLGSPSATGTFDPDRWYYISGVSRTRIGRVPGVSDQRVVALSFDPGGVLREVRELGEADARQVAVVERTTPVPGNERNLLQALFGNIGRFGTGGVSAPVGPGASAPPP